MWAPTLPGAERGTVNGMLPDSRFVLGAILAIALLAVAGLGLVTSVQLVHQARMGPLEDSRSLAYAGHAEWNQFYDPDGARRFEGLAGKTEGPLAGARRETPDETSPVIVPVDPEERTASLPANRLEPDIADGKTSETDPPHMVEPPAPETIAAAPAEAAGAPASDAPGTNGSRAPPADRVARAPATSPGPHLPQEKQAEAQAPAQPQATGDPLQDSAPPIPRARPKTHFRRKIARAHIRRVGLANPQTLQNSGFPMAVAPWPGYDTPFTGATTTKKNTGKLTGALSKPPQ
jgi:hypothetical protein